MIQYQAPSYAGTCLSKSEWDKAHNDSVREAKEWSIGQMKAGIVAPAPPADHDAQVLSHLVGLKTLDKGYVWWAAENYKRLGGGRPTDFCHHLPEQLKAAKQAEKDAA
jgi:hypothetical protein